MPELDTPAAWPLLEEVESQTDLDTGTGEAPYGYKADGTPRAKPGRKVGSGNGSGTATRGAKDDKFAGQIADELVDLSVPLALVSPMAMVHVERRADRTAIALVSISKKYPRVKHAIETYFNSVAYKDIAMFVTGIPVAVMIDFGRIPASSKLGLPFNMEEIYLECYGEEGSERVQERAAARGLAAEVA